MGQIRKKHAVKEEQSGRWIAYCGYYSYPDMGIVLLHSNWRRAEGYRCRRCELAIAKEERKHGR